MTFTCRTELPDVFNDGVTDNAGLFEDLWQKKSDQGGGKLVIPPGRYHSSIPVVFGIPEGGDTAYRPTCIIEAWGAVFDNTVVFSDPAIVVEGMQVIGSPSHGFVFTRGQGALFQRLHAEANKGHGFFFGSDGFAANSQVTASQWDLPTSLSNELDGFHVSGTANVNRNWFNQNQLNTPIARLNLGRGFGSEAGTVPEGSSVSRMNYNSYINVQQELNGDISEFANMNQRANVFIGGLVADQNETQTESLILADINYYFGGRIRRDVPNKTNNTIFANTSATGEGTRFSYDPSSDLD